MRITINPVFDIETGKLVAHDGQYEYAGPVALAKDGTAQAQNNINTATGLESTYAGDATQANNEVLPFLNSEMTNPQGFGQTGVNELNTAGGQAVSGAVGAGDEAANLRASRTGNPSSSASIIDAITRSGAQQQSNNALGVDTANLKEKLAQQQAGASGIAAQGGQDLNAALSALGLNNGAVGDYTKASEASNPLNMIEGILGAAGKGAEGIGAGIGKAGG